MSPAAFRQQWNRHYPDIEPVGYELRNAGAEYWIRFHSLPDSKRYAETDDEWRILLTRQNLLAAAVLGDEQDCWLVQSLHKLPPGQVEIAVDGGIDPFGAIAGYGLESAVVSVREAGTEFEERWEAFAGIVKWTSGRFDGLLREIADWSAPTIWYSSETGAIFAPYDGGVDLFLPDESRVSELAAKHADWLSIHPLGL